MAEETPKAADGSATAAGVAGKVAATPAARRLAAEKKLDLAAVTPTGKHGEVKERDVKALGSVAVSPLAKKIAAETGIELAA